MTVYNGCLTHWFFFLSSNITLEFYAKFEGQRFLETGDISRPGTNSMSLGGSPRVAQRICFSFHGQLSVWKFMPKPLVNVFSKLAMPQDLGPIPCHLETLQGWPNAFAFLSIVEYQFVFLQI